MKTRLFCFLLTVVGWQSQLVAQGQSLQAANACEVGDSTNYSAKFDFTTDTLYRPNNNYLLAQLALLAYGTETEIEAQISRWNRVRSDQQDKLKHSVEEKCKDQFLIVSTDSFIILSFRGTKNLKNIASDLDMKLIEFEEGVGLVHRGFYKTIKKLDKKIQKTLESHQRQGADQPLYLTGHSLGGALALLYPFVHDQQIKFTQITTFGQPKVGDQKLISYLKKRTQAKGLENDRYFRLVNASDLVASLPAFDYSCKIDSFIFYRQLGTKYIFAGYPDTIYSLIPTGCDPTEYQKPEEELAVQLNFPYHGMCRYLKFAEMNKDTSLFSR